MTIAWLWIVVKAFLESVLWGLLSLILVPIVAVIYAFIRFEKCRIQLALFGVGMLIYVIGLTVYLIQGLLS